MVCFCISYISSYCGTSAMDRLCVFLLFLSSNTPVLSVPAGHSMGLYITYVIGETAFPEFSTVVTFDDIQVGYFDPKTKTIYKTGNLHDKVELENFDLNMISEMHAFVRTRSSIMLQHFNVTEGVHVYQNMRGCQSTANGESDLFVVQHSFDAVDLYGYHCNKTNFSFWTGNTWQSQWGGGDQILLRRKRECIKTWFPLCIETRHNFLKTNKNWLLRRVRPRLHFLQKEIPGGAKVTCLATDFFPPHINLTLLRDGKPVVEQQQTGGSVLPNGNGLYQVRKSLELTSEELRERHIYTCVASHLSVDNKLEITWQPSGGRSYRLLVLSVPLLLGLALALLLLVLGCWRMRRMRGMRQNADTMTSQPLQASQDDKQMDTSSL